MQSAAPQLTDTSARTVLGAFLFTGDDVHKLAGVLSGGEKTRLALASLGVRHHCSFLGCRKSYNQNDVRERHEREKHGNAGSTGRCWCRGMGFAAERGDCLKEGEARCPEATVVNRHFAWIANCQRVKKPLKAYIFLL